MKTDDLIAALAKDLEPAPPARRPWRLALALSVGAGLGLVLFSVFLSVRPDIGVALDMVLMKAGFAAAFTIAALAALLRLARPGKSAGASVLTLVGLLGASLVVALSTGLGAAPDQRFQAWMGGGFPWCVVAIPLLAAPMAAALVWLVRDLAPTRLGLTGAAIGAFSGGVGAMLYAMSCPVDSVAFVTTWYALAIALSAALASVIAARFLRW